MVQGFLGPQVPWGKAVGSASGPSVCFPFLCHICLVLSLSLLEVALLPAHLQKKGKGKGRGSAVWPGFPSVPLSPWLKVQQPHWLWGCHDHPWSMARSQGLKCGQTVHPSQNLGILISSPTPLISWGDTGTSHTGRCSASSPVLLSLKFSIQLRQEFNSVRKTMRRNKTSGEILTDVGWFALMHAHRANSFVRGSGICSCIQHSHFYRFIYFMYVGVWSAGMSTLLLNLVPTEARRGLWLL